MTAVNHWNFLIPALSSMKLNFQSSNVCYLWDSSAQSLMMQRDFWVERWEEGTEFSQCLVVVGRLRSRKISRQSAGVGRNICAYTRMQVLLNSLIGCQRSLREGKFVFYHRGRKQILHVENSDQEFICF